MSFFALSKAFWAVGHPVSLAILAILAGTVIQAATKRRRGFVLVGLGTIGLAAMVFLPAGQWLIEPLETRFPERDVPPAVDGIIVLGGVADVRLAAQHRESGIGDTAGRITAVVALAHRFPRAVVIVSGGGPEYEVPEAEVIGATLVRLGMSPEQIRLETVSRNTYENALFSMSLAQPNPEQVWLLVTSAFHMPRAIGCFRRVGWNVTPFPVDYRAPMDTTYVEELRLVELATKEWIGLVAYRVADRILDLFPAPSVPERP
jgi:uncharacterized SAM-binding protein YcdF (DUF218 family)